MDTILTVKGSENDSNNKQYSLQAVFLVRHSGH